VSHIQPNFKLGPKLDESVMTALKSYCYPFTISKSHLSTIGVQHTWPPLLAALSFLRVCIEVCVLDTAFSDEICMSLLGFVSIVYLLGVHYSSTQCFDAVGWAAGMVSGL